MNEQPGKQLIDNFFNDLALRQLTQCQAHLYALEKVARQRPTYQSWCIYLQGILANELYRDWAEGERLFTTLLEAELEPALSARVLIALGRTYDYQGRWTEALLMYQRCLTVFDQPEQVIDRATIWRNMAITLEKGFTHSDFDDEALLQAVRYCQLALTALQDLAESERTETPPEAITWNIATTWNTLGVIYRNLGDWPQATHCYQQFIALGRDLKDDHSVGMGSNNLGEVLQRQGSEKWSEAGQAYLEALKIYREFSDNYEQIDTLANLALLQHHMGDLTAALNYYEQAITLIEVIRASVTAEAGRAGYFTTVTDTYANATLLCLEMGEQERAFNIVEQTCSRAFLDVLVAGSVDLPRERELAATITLPEVQAALPPETLLLEYFTTGLLEVRAGRSPTNPNVRRHRFPLAKTLLFAITRDTVQVHEVGFSPNDLRPEALDNVVERHFLKDPIRRTLYDQLIGPVTALLEGKRRLYLVPHGPLHYIPFQTLLAPDGDTLLREGGPQLIYGPCATLLFCYGRVKPNRAPQPCLTVGYNSEGLTQLYFAEAEARRVAQISSGYALTGPAQKKEYLYREARHYRLLHFACHGEFDPETPLASFLEVAPAERLTAQEVLEHMPLHCDLVTLSACESGLSRVRRGDELIGFSRAFMYAGAPALISTLWRVNDHPTRLLMERFYREVATGVGFAEALKRAQLYLKNLTYQEVLDLLTAFQEDPPEADPPPSLPGPTLFDPSRSGLTLPQAMSYLRGVTRGDSNETVASPPADPDPMKKVFADPYYWGAFVLVGGHGS